MTTKQAERRLADLVLESSKLEQAAIEDPSQDNVNAFEDFRPKVVEAATKVALERQAKEADEAELKAKLQEDLDHPYQRQLNRESNRSAHAMLRTIFEASWLNKEATSIEFLPAQVAPDPSPDGNTRVRYHCEDTTGDGHFIAQEQMKVPMETFEAMLDSEISQIHNHEFALQTEGKSAMTNIATMPFEVMELANNIGLDNAVKTGDSMYPALTTFMSKVEHTRDSVAPMLNGRFWNLLATPGNVSPMVYEQILVDVAAGYPAEGAEQSESDPTWNQVTLRCHQINSNGAFTRWAEWGTFIRSLPRELRRSVVKDVFRKANKGLTDGAGGTANPYGLITEVDAYENAPWSITPGDYSILKDKGANATTNPFSFGDLAEIQDLMDDGQVEGDKMFFMAHRRFFGNIRTNLYNTNPGTINAMWPLMDLSKANRMQNVFGEMWQDLAVSNRHFSRKYDTGNTTHVVYVNGDERTHRYLPLIVEFNPYRQSDKRVVSVEATCGVDGLFTGSAGGPTAAEEAPPVTRGHTNP